VTDDSPGDALALKIAIVGAGMRCRSFLRLLDTPRMQRLDIQVLGVADINPEADAWQEAEARGTMTTTDYRVLLDLPDLELIVELTGDPAVLRDLSERKPKSVGLIDSTAALLIHDIASYGGDLDRRAEEDHVERALARTLTAASSEGVMVLDANFRILRVNEAACRWAAMPCQEASGRFCFQVLHDALGPCESPETPCPMRETLATGRPAHCIHEFRDLQGNAHYCDVTTYPLMKRREQTVQVLEIFRDITEQMSRRMERRTMAIKKDLARMVQEDKLRALGKLVASVAHEINNPIGSIINFDKLVLRCLREGTPSAADRKQWEEWLTLTVQEAERCRDIVQRLLSFARQQSMEPKVLDLVEALDQIIKVTRHRMEIGEVGLTVDLPQQRLDVRGDATQIQQCFTNLVFNALEAMPEGGHLTIAAHRTDEGEPSVTVTDTGKGIAADVMPHIFEPFFSTKSALTGVGLGLSMVHGIVSEHGGRIEVDSEPEKGTTFRVILPPAASAEDPGE